MPLSIERIQSFPWAAGIHLCLFTNTPEYEYLNAGPSLAIISDVTMNICVHLNNKHNNNNAHFILFRYIHMHTCTHAPFLPDFRILKLTEEETFSYFKGMKAFCAPTMIQ